MQGRVAHAAHSCERCERAAGGEAENPVTCSIPQRILSAGEWTVDRRVRSPSQNSPVDCFAGPGSASSAQASYRLHRCTPCTSACSFRCASSPKKGTALEANGLSTRRFDASLRPTTFSRYREQLRTEKRRPPLPAPFPSGYCPQRQIFSCRMGQVML